MSRPLVILEWCVGAIRLGDGRWVRSLDSHPKSAPTILRLHERLKAFGFTDFLVDLAVYPAQWLDPAESDAELQSARAILEANGLQGIVRTPREVPFYSDGGIDVRAWMEHWLKNLPAQNQSPLLLLGTRSLLVPKEDLEELVQTAATGQPRAANRIGYPSESATAYHPSLPALVREKGYFPPEYVETINKYRTRHDFSFDATFAFLPVVEALAQKGAPEAWSYDLLDEVRREDPERFRPFFQHVGVELTNDDNLPDRLRCLRKFSARPIGRMSEETWAHILDGCRADLTSPSMDFWDGGEPLLHPRALEWAEEAVRRGIRVDLYTNGLLLDRPVAERAVRAGLDALFLRIDAATPETYARVTGDPSGWEKLQKNLEDLLAAKRGVNQDATAAWRPTLVFQCTEMPETAADFDAFMDRHDRAARIRDRLRKEAGREPSPAEIRRDLYPAYPVEYATIRHDNLFRGRVQRNGGMDVVPLRRFPCKMLSEGPYVLWNGDIVPCRTDLDGESVAGNVRNGLLEAWRSDLFRSLFQVHSEGRWEGHPLCGSCREWYYPHA